MSRPFPIMFDQPLATDMVVSFSHYVILLSSIFSVHSSPPDVCHEPFKWQDCGGPPKAVMYYWKPGSRCEVGYWRGCLPNHNMFRDEYECVTTCIFSARAMPDDYHGFNEINSDYEPVEENYEDYKDFTNETNTGDKAGNGNQTDNITETNEDNGNNSSGYEIEDDGNGGESNSNVQTNGTDADSNGESINEPNTDDNDAKNEPGGDANTEPKNETNGDTGGEAKDDTKADTDDKRKDRGEESDAKKEAPDSRRKRF